MPSLWTASEGECPGDLLPAEFSCLELRGVQAVGEPEMGPELPATPRRLPGAGLGPRGQGRAPTWLLSPPSQFCASST